MYKTVFVKSWFFSLSNISQPPKECHTSQWDSINHTSSPYSTGFIDLFSLQKPFLLLGAFSLTLDWHQNSYKGNTVLFIYVKFALCFTQSLFQVYILQLDSALFSSLHTLLLLTYPFFLVHEYL